MSRTLHAPLAAVAIAALSGVSAANDLTGPDLVISAGEFVEFYEFSGSLVFGLAYTMVNAGDAPADLHGPTGPGGGPGDNVGIQTYISTTPDFTGQTRAAGGGIITDPVVLGPGAVYEGIFLSNSAQLTDPLDLGPFGWLIVDIVETGETGPALANNRVSFRIPTPCGRADRAAPIGTLDLADVTRFVGWFMAGSEPADYNSDGLYSLEDIIEFVETFLAGC